MGVGSEMDARSEALAIGPAMWETLAATERQADRSRQEAKALTETTSRLRAQLVRMAKLVEHVSHFAFHDELTGLPNRALLLDRFHQATVLALRQDKRVGLLTIKLHVLEQVNDAYGHRTGDSLLQRVAWLLSTCVRGSDTVCRYGGDDFVIMLPGLEGSGCAAAVVQRIKARLAASFFAEGGLIPVTANIGVAIFPEDGLDFEALMERANNGMCQDKVQRNAAGENPTHGCARPGVQVGESRYENRVSLVISEVNNHA